MKKISLIALYICFMATIAQSQVAIGLRAGGSINRFSFPDKYLDTYTFNTKFGYNAGLVLEIPLGGRLAMQAEVNYATRGSKYTEPFIKDFPYDSAGVTRRVGIYPQWVTDLTYLDIPLLFKYKFRGRPVGGHLMAGFNFGTGLGGNEKLTLQDANRQEFPFNQEKLILQQLKAQKEDPILFSKNADENVDYLPGNTGLIGGAGLSLDTEVLRFNLDVRYFLGTSSLFNSAEKRTDKNFYVWGYGPDEGFDIKNRSLQVSLTVLYPFGGGW